MRSTGFWIKGVAIRFDSIRNPRLHCFVREFPLSWRHLGQHTQARFLSPNSTEDYPTAILHIRFVRRVVMPTVYCARTFQPQSDQARDAYERTGKRSSSRI